MGRFIRFFTREQYNHVSLSVDDELQQFVSFARYRQDVPLAGGYVAEPPVRLLSCGKTMPVKIFRLEISPADVQQLEALFTLAGQTPLVYNSPGALLSSCHIPCPIPCAYTCLEFAGAILGENFPSIQALGTALEPWEFYRGDLFDIINDNGIGDNLYFQKRGFWKGIHDTARHFKILLLRILRLDRPHDIVKDYSFDILRKNIPQSSI